MKTMYQYGLSAALIFSGLSAQAQSRPAGPLFSLGTPQALVKQLEAQVAKTSAARAASTVSLRVSGSQVFTGQVNYRQDLASTGEYVIGEIQGVPGSSFRLRIEGAKVEGNIILRDTKQAYQYSADAQGNAVVQKVDINKLICVDFNKPVGYKALVRQGANRTAVVSLQSLPGARGCILLDFDGYNLPAGSRWNGGNALTAAPAGMTDAAIQEFWELVSEDFRALNLNVTTDEAVYNSFPATMRQRCIVTPTNTVAPGAGGVSYVGSFNYGDNTPCWEFMADAKYGGEAASHELGHSMGLSHDGRISPAEEYYNATNTTGPWAPIMGSGYYKPVTTWSRGEYASANNQEDDLAIMSGTTYNVGYRNDDRSNGTAGATPLATSGTSLSGAGVIERASDQDFFVFTCGAGTVSLNVNAVSRHADLNVVARLYDSGGGLLGTYDTPNNLNTSLSANLGAGTYYLSVDGGGEGDPVNGGYSDYASLGNYSIAGTAPVGGPATGTAVVSRDCACGGTATGLDAGDYTLGQLQSRGIIDNDISALKVGVGYEVQLFEFDNFTGASIVLGAANDCLVGVGWNDRATSLKVRTSGDQTLSGIYTLQNRNSALFMDVSGASTADGANVQQWAYGGGGNQQWRFVHLGGGVYEIQAVHSGKVLDVSGASTADGANVQQWTYGGGANQQFIAQPIGGGFYKLVARHSGKLVEVGGSSTAVGGNVQQWPDNGTATQQWKLTAVSAPFSRQLEAELANVNNGMVVEACTDAGGGQDMGYVDPGDYLVWNAVNFPTTGSYLIEYRVASGAAGGTLSSDLNAGTIQLGNTTIPATGGWQNWVTVSKTVAITAGTYNFGVFAQSAGWNINWVRISKVAGSSIAQAAGSAPAAASLTLYPNPVTDRLTLASGDDFRGEQVRILSIEGRVVWLGIYTGESVDVSALRPGLYTLVVVAKDHQKLVSRFSKE